MGKVHMLRHAPDAAMTRETFCLRTSNGGGIGGAVMAFSCDRGDFQATEHATLVTCKPCMRRMGWPA